MKLAARALLASSLLVAGASASAADVSEDCDRERIAAHVLREFAIYGPLSGRVEYFGFVYRSGNVIRSSIIRSASCVSGECVIQVARAGKRIPRGAQVVGEWHTHPHRGAPELSDDDVRGAGRNRHLGCYSAFYSDPEGEIFAWNPGESSVTRAMATRLRIGNYADRLAMIE